MVNDTSQRLRWLPLLIILNLTVLFEVGIEVTLSNCRRSELLPQTELKDLRNLCSFLARFRSSITPDFLVPMFLSVRKPGGAGEFA